MYLNIIKDTIYFKGFSEAADMIWKEIMERFSGLPAQERVVKLLMERGFQVNDKGRVVSGNIEIPHTQIAREAGVERRVVDSTTKTILNDEVLKKIFQNMQSIPMLKDVATELGFNVLIVVPENARNTGILGDVATTVARHNISIRQAVTDDPYLSDNPQLTIVTDARIPGELIEEIKNILSVKSITIY